MGEYWKPVNLTKREYIHPHDLRDGLKLDEWGHFGPHTMAMIRDRWQCDDTVVYVSDYGGFRLVSGVGCENDSPAYDSLDDDGYMRISGNSQ